MMLALQVPDGWMELGVVLVQRTWIRLSAATHGGAAVSEMTCVSFVVADNLVSCFTSSLLAVHSITNAIVVLIRG
jgi:hypothetical protein